jgi:hypothetical protein
MTYVQVMYQAQGEHLTLIFDTTCVKLYILWGVLCEGALNFLTLLLFKFIICTYLTHPKLNLNFTHALNFVTIYLFEFLVLVQSMKHLDVLHHKDKMFRKIFFDTSISLLFPTKHNIFSLTISLKGIKNNYFPGL